ncbi:hypothetical protein DPMN_055034 [Dreissena polymorpha]|uniref:Uncharacterized protein n=1 Tax=Dreissena polymorpha TaxID=45954 RepID=A0A9D4HS56_DREPO|nr:hypothetical protein DPMN_055034 [Dreissena polymorpha]
MNSRSNVHLEINRALAERVANNAKVIENVAKTVLLCGRQNLALRGDRDDSKYFGEGTNTGNFQALLDFRVELGMKF